LKISQFENLKINWPLVIGYCSFARVLIFFFLFSIFIFGCKSKRLDISNIKIDLKVERFEKDLFSVDSTNRNAAIRNLTTKYGDFFYFYFNDFRWQSDSDRSWDDSIIAYISDTTLHALYDSVEKRFSDFTSIEKELNTSLRYFKYYFPETSIPTIITIINSPGHGAFTYGDSILCIALEDYMSPQFSFYKYLDIPNYLVRRFKPEYIVPNCLQVMITKQFPFDPTSKKLLDAMVYNGKVMYLKSQFMPENIDSLTTGFRNKDLKWCSDNEKEIWKFFIDKNLLYSQDPLEYMKFVNDGPTTSGMPPESPGNVGSWVGWRIVSSYMKKHPEISLQQLMSEQDTQKILTDSRYKP